MMQKIRDEETAAVRAEQERLASRERFVRDIHEQQQLKLRKEQLRVEQLRAEERAERATREAYNNAVAAARRYLIEEHAPVLQEYFPKVRMLTLNICRMLLC